VYYQSVNKSANGSRYVRSRQTLIVRFDSGRMWGNSKEMGERCSQNRSLSGSAGARTMSVQHPEDIIIESAKVDALGVVSDNSISWMCSRGQMMCQPTWLTTC
jgi:hypothetical protein